jgi:hypothetical protein
MQSTKIPAHVNQALGIGAASSGGPSARQNNSDFAGDDHVSPFARRTCFSRTRRILRKGTTNSMALLEVSAMVHKRPAMKPGIKTPSNSSFSALEVSVRWGDTTRAFF